jgi:bacteriocin-like protein
MASIRISDLSVDSESFLDELSESDLATINGGFWPFVLIGIGLALYPRSAY